MMRIEAPKGLIVSAEASKSNWTIRLAPTALKPQRFLKPERKAGAASRPCWSAPPVSSGSRIR